MLVLKRRAVKSTRTVARQARFILQGLALYY
jgi:hypothetical protein